MFAKFKDMKLGVKIFGGFSVVLLLLCFLSSQGILGLINVADRVEKTVDLYILVKSQVQARVQEKNFILRNNKESIDNLNGILGTIKDQIIETKNDFSDQYNKDQMDQAMQSSEQYKSAFESFRDLRNQKEKIMDSMRQIANEALIQCDAINMDQQKQLHDYRAKNKVVLNEKIKNANDANQLLLYTIEAKGYRLLLMEGKLDVLDNWKALNQKIFDLTRDLRSRFTLEKNIKQADQILSAYQTYETRVLSFLQTQNSTEKDQLVKSAITAMNEMKNIQFDQMNQLEKARADFDKILDDKLAKSNDASLIEKLFIDARKNEKEVIISGAQHFMDKHEELIQKCLSIGADLRARFRLDNNIKKIDAAMSKITSYQAAYKKYIECTDKQKAVEQSMLQAAKKNNKICEDALKDQEQKMDREITQARTMIIIWSVSAIVLGLLLAFFITRGITQPIIKSVQFTETMANGDFRESLEIHQKDEIGTLSNALNKMITNLRSMIKSISQNVSSLSSSSTELATISEQLSNGADDSSKRSNSVATATEEMSSNMTTVAAAVEQASSNVEMVASAAEQMTTTINEIAGNASKTREITSSAVEKSKNASSRVHELGAAATEIGTVTETITNISEQTNLLALNATIEAARAGDAGKGFAVVANEIKELAKQTALATEEIKKQIEGIQQSTSSSVLEIGQITDVIQNVNEYVTAIAAAIEEQSVAIKDIALNISQASLGIQEVSSNVAQTSVVSKEIARDINEVNHSNQESLTSSKQVKESARDLSKIAEELNKMVSRFKV